MEVYHLDPLNSQEIKTAVQDAVRLLLENKIIVVPTDTCYGLATLIKKRNINRLLKIKGRPSKKPISIFVPDLDYLKNISQLGEKEEDFIKKHFRTPHTFILKLRKERREEYEMIAPQKTIGVRIVKKRFIKELLNDLGQLITATSANVSDKNPCYQLTEFLGQFQNRKYWPDAFFNAGLLPKRRPSRVTDLTKKPYQTYR